MLQDINSENPLLNQVYLNNINTKKKTFDRDIVNGGMDLNVAGNILGAASIKTLIDLMAEFKGIKSLDISNQLA